MKTPSRDVSLLNCGPLELYHVCPTYSAVGLHQDLLNAPQAASAHRANDHARATLQVKICGTKSLGVTMGSYSELGTSECHQF